MYRINGLGLDNMDRWEMIQWIDDNPGLPGSGKLQRLQCIGPNPGDFQWIDIKLSELYVPVR